MERQIKNTDRIIVPKGSRNKKALKNKRKIKTLKRVKVKRQQSTGHFHVRLKKKDKNNINVEKDHT